MNKVAWALNYRPLTVLGTAFCLRDIIFGLGFILSWYGIMETTIYLSVFTIIPATWALIAFGVILVLVSSVQIWALISLNNRWINVMGTTQGVLWLFVSLGALLIGLPANALIFLLVFNFPSVYISYSVRNEHRWIRKEWSS